MRKLTSTGFSLVVLGLAAAAIAIGWNWGKGKQIGRGY